MADQTWTPKPGDKAVVLIPRTHCAPVLHEAKVLRVGKRDVIVMTEGNREMRFNVNTLTRQGDEWRGAWRLLHPDAADVARASKAILAERLRATARNAAADFDRNPNAETATAAIAALNDYLGLER